jgi:adenylylsulfate kinase-like enzyme
MTGRPIENQLAVSGHKKQTCFVIMAGLPGTGKSTLSRNLADQLNGIVLDKDLVRDALFGENWTEYSRQLISLLTAERFPCARRLTVWPIMQRTWAAG